MALNKHPPVQISPGVLNKEQTEQLVNSGEFITFSKGCPEIDGSSFDLKLSDEVLVLPTGGRPSTRELSKLMSSAKRLERSGSHFVFEKEQIYLAKLDGYLSLPQNISGRATGKSSIGRLDVITRLITNNSREYDLVEAGYDRDLYLLVVPQTFSITAKPGDSLNQLRLFSGHQSDSIVKRREVACYGTEFWWVIKRPPVGFPDLSGGNYESWSDVLCKVDASLTLDPTLFDLTVDLDDPKEPFIFQAIRGEDESQDHIDVTKSSYYDPIKYFKKVEVEGNDRSVTLEAGSFYIMKSKERLAIPTDIAVEVIAISERIGDIRIHYAGFAHPGFGRDDVRGGNAESDRLDRPNGTPLIFEVRATDMNTKLYHGSTLARIQLFRMSERVDDKKLPKSPYDRQELKLSKVFSDWPEVSS